MTTVQILKIAKQVAKKFEDAERIDRSSVIREVVRLRKFNLEDSIIMADCIVKGLFFAGKTIIVKV